MLNSVCARAGVCVCICMSVCPHVYLHGGECVRLLVRLSVYIMCACVCVCVCMCMSPYQVGGVEEYEVIEAMKDGRITKPLVSWCIGTCGSFFSSEVSTPYFPEYRSSPVNTSPVST